MSSSSSPTKTELSSSALTSVFDTYICKEPAGDASPPTRNGADEYTASLRMLQRSADYYAEKDQMRLVERIRFEQAKLHIQHQQWQQAMRILVPLWQNMTWRRSGWWQLLTQVDQVLLDCAEQVNDVDTLVAVQWELLNNELALTPRQDIIGDFHDILQRVAPPKSRPKVKLRAGNILSCVSAGFAFSRPNGNVGLPLPSQLVLRSHLRSASQPFSLKRVTIIFQGGIQAICIDHSDPDIDASKTDTNPTFQNVQFDALTRQLDDDRRISSDRYRHGVADLTVSPGHLTVLAFSDIPREAGQVEVQEIILEVAHDSFDLEISSTESIHLQQHDVFDEVNGKLIAKKIRDGPSHMVAIAPRPPKLHLEILGLYEEHYTDEVLKPEIQMINNEDEAINLVVQVSEVGDGDSILNCHWDDDHASTSETDNELNIGLLSTSERRSCAMRIRAPQVSSSHELEVIARYTLLSDPDTQIVKALRRKLEFKPPLEVLSSYSPLIHPEPWPDYFDAGNVRADMGNEKLDDDIEAQGLKQRWALTSRLTSLSTSTELLIEGMSIKAVSIDATAHCNVTLNEDMSVKLTPEELVEKGFMINAQKIDIEDRRPDLFDLQLCITWRRPGATDPPALTTISLPELAIPFGEPRVLTNALVNPTMAVATPPPPSSVVHMEYWIENPSLYTLTFSVTMETSEEFAFAGLKNVHLQLVPLSRQRIRYRLLPLVKGTWISPHLKVYDTQFHKTLSVYGTEGIRHDRKGLSIWIDADG